MRPQQQNRRMRGRGNNGGGGGGNNNNNQNRRGPNPLTRTYESNGPDVKIRGTAQQVADKYATLARDAMSSGDRVMAENYLQHAEHYNRIIATAQAQISANIQMPREQRNDLDDDMDDERDDFDQPMQIETPRPIQANDGSGPQPVIEGMPAEVALEQAAINGANGHGEQRAQQPRQSDGQDDGQRRRNRRPRRGNRDRGEAGEGETGDHPAGEGEPMAAKSGSEPALSDQD